MYAICAIPFWCLLVYQARQETAYMSSLIIIANAINSKTFAPQNSELLQNKTWNVFIAIKVCKGAPRMLVEGEGCLLVKNWYQWLIKKRIKEATGRAFFQLGSAHHWFFSGKRYIFTTLMKLSTGLILLLTYRFNLDFRTFICIQASFVGQNYPLNWKPTLDQTMCIGAITMEQRG